MKVLVLGAAGFIGGHVGRSLRARGEVRRLDRLAPIDEIVLADARSISAHRAAPSGVTIRCMQGDVSDPRFLDALFSTRFDLVFHLAASLTLDAESNFERGMQVNIYGLLRLLEKCREQHNAPGFVFASSLSTFGGPLAEIVDDHVAQTPQTSYGTHKAVAELLINDYSRRNFIDGRVLRLPIVLTHPGPPTNSVSDRIAALVREPLGGREAICPLEADTRFPVASVQSVARALIAAAALPAAAFGATRVMNLPSLTVTPGEIAAALERRLGTESTGRITWQRDDQIQAIVESWPRVFTSQFALDHGIRTDASIDAIVDAYLARDRDGT